ncbi:ABC transporter substrate-binding protein [Patescibacteria group bacterium]
MKLIKKIRYYFRLFPVFIKKQRRTILLGFIVGGLIFYLAPKLYFQVFQKKIERIGLVGRFQASNLPLEIQEKISLGLTKINASKEVEPSLAGSWSAKKSGKEYHFTLKENLYWQDGSPLTAKEINYNFSDVTTTVINEKTLVFQLLEPFSPFPTIVSRPVFKKGLVGVGEYRVKSLSRQGEIVEEIILVPNDSSKPILNYRLYPNETAAITAFKLGEIDTLKNINSSEKFELWPEIKITEKVEKNQYVALFFNTQSNRLSDKSFRQALAYSIKKDWSSRAISPISPLSWAYNPSVKDYDYDLENAKTLFKKSFEEDEEGQEKIEIVLTTTPSLLKEAEKIASDWLQLGIETKVRLASTLEEDFEVLLLTQTIPIDPDQYSFWHSTQVNNITGYKNPKIDKLLEDGRKTLNQKEREKFYDDFQRFIVEETPAIFLFHPIVYTIERQ